MKTAIQKVKESKDEEVLIRCVEITKEVKDIYSYALSKGTELVGNCEEKIVRFRLEDICYFEAVDEKVFAYTKDKVYEVKGRLYEFEEAYSSHHFIRCSKSVVLNLMQLVSISPALNSRFFAHMKNGEKVMITRQYVKDLKKAVMGER
jgi:DNA-binding LytR/AlgR family response regulator